MLFTYFWLLWVLVAALGLSLVVPSGDCSLAVLRLHFSGFSCCEAWALEHAGSVIVLPGLSCPVACGIFLDQGLNLWPLHWQADS